MLELGAIGAVIALALLWLVAVRLDAVPRRSRDCGQILLVSGLTTACISFGLWQNWWLALIISVALPVPLTAAPAVHDEATGRH